MSASFDPAGLVARARAEGSADLDGIRLDLVPGAPPDTALIVSCSGLCPPDRIAYAFENTSFERPVHRLFVADRTNRWYQAGVSGLTTSLPRTLDMLAGIVDAIGAARVLAVGTSMGGYLALHVALRGIAPSALAFSPQTTLDPAWRRAIEDRRWADDIDAGLRAASPADRSPDVLDAIAAGSGAVLHIFYPGREPPDVAHAERLAGRRGVILYKIDTIEHTISHFLRNRGVLVPIIARVLAGDTPTDLVAELRDEPDTPEALFRAARAAVTAGQAAEAESLFRRAAVDPDGPAHYRLELAQLLARQGQREEARAIVDDMARRAPDNPHIRFVAGEFDLQDGRVEQAVASFARAVSLDPKIPYFHERLAAARARLGTD